jgi:hypothetical protein
MSLLRLLAAVCLTALAADSVRAVDLSRIDAPLVREPAYQTKAPRYALLVLGSEAQTRIWIVCDGTTLYVDRNGNGDLTEAGEKVVAQKGGTFGLEDEVCTFAVGELRDGRQRCLNVSVRATDLAASYGLKQSSAEAKALLARDPHARTWSIHMEVEVPGRRGAGAEGRVVQLAGPADVNGLLQFAERPQDAPVLHFGGPWTITLDGRPTLRINRDIEVTLSLGTPGRGRGTFASVGYEGVIPADIAPRAEITFPPQRPGDPPVKAVYELKQRC